MVKNKPRRIDKNFRLAVAQLNPIVGDIEGNLAKARAARAKAADKQADLVIFPPYFISGSPFHQLDDKDAFIDQCYQANTQLQRDTSDGGPAVILLKAIHERDNNPDPLYGTQFFDDGKIWDFDSDLGFNIRGLQMGFFIYCTENAPLENGQFFLMHYSDDAHYQSGCQEFRLQWCQKRVKEHHHRPVIFVNAFGGQDGLVFDGGSFGLQPNGEVAFQMPHFAESIYVSEWEKTQSGWWCRDGEVHELYQDAAADYHACMIGLRDYVNKNGFKGVLLGLSGGVDSALCAALAVDALGADRVSTVMLPYHYTSAQSLRDAQDCAKRLGCAYQTIPIAAPVEAFLEALQPAFGDALPDVTEENLQSRARGVILMALSNKFGSLLLTTGNKSESAVGYATLYGDMCGGFNPVKDLYKRDVYALCHWRNNHMPNSGLGPKGEIIPQNILNRSPSAELRPDQKDEDSLPPYPVLDAILHGLIEDNKTIADLVGQGFEREMVERVEDLLYKGAFKRRQAAPGVKISSRSFDDWNMPITHRFRDRT